MPREDGIIACSLNSDAATTGKLYTATAALSSAAVSQPSTSTSLSKHRILGINRRTGIGYTDAELQYDL